MRLRLASRIVLFFVLLSATLLASVGVLSYGSGSESLKAAAISDMLGNAIEKEAHMVAWIEERVTDIARIAKSVDQSKMAANLIAAAPGSEGARSAHALLLQELEPYVIAARPDFTELFVVDPESGKVVASTSSTEEGKSKLGNPYFEHGKTDLYLQPPYYSADIMAPAMTVAVPMRATGGRVVAVLAAHVDLAALNAIAQRRTGIRQTEDAFLFNAGQFALTQPRFMREPAVFASQARHRGCPSRSGR